MWIPYLPPNVPIPPKHPDFQETSSLLSSFTDLLFTLLFEDPNLNCDSDLAGNKFQISRIENLLNLYLREKLVKEVGLYSVGTGSH